MEKNLSYWMASTALDHRPQLPGDRSTEVCVVGAGITGLTTAYLLAREGVPVIVVESERVSAGVTGSTTAKVTALHRLIYSKLEKQHGAEVAQHYATAQMRGIEQIATAAVDEGIDCDLQRAPAYTYTQQKENVSDIEREVEVAQRVGLGATFHDTVELPYEVEAAIRLDDQVIIHPRRYCAGLADAIERLGGTIYEKTWAKGVHDGATCTLETDHGRITARAIVLATQTPFIFKGFFFARTTASRSYALAAERDDLPEGMYISVEEPTRSVRPHRGRDGNILILGGGGHPTGREEDTQSEYDDLEAWARTTFGIEKPSWQWSAQDFQPADGLPYVGTATPRSKIYIATGYAKWGISNGAAAGMAIADHIAGRSNEWAKPFAASRYAPLKEAGMVLSQGAETARSIVKERIVPPGEKSPDELQPGEGTVYRSGVSPVAVYRTDDGDLRAVSAVCTHMGCVVHFNDAERSWDCPCHGSRFDVDGHVLSGPATDPLEEVDLPDKA